MKKILLLFLLAAAIFLAYAPALQNGFVWDDTALVSRDPLIRSWRLIPEGFQHFLFTDATASDFYRPLQRLSYTLDYAAFHFRPTGYHFTSIACHVAAAMALYFFALELLLSFKGTGRFRAWVPYVAALAWALHPLQTSAVVYISGRADPLAAAFGFFGLFLVWRSLRTMGFASWTFQLAAGAALFLSGLSKEAGLIFLAVGLVLLALLKNWRATLRFSVTALFVLVSYFSLRLSAEHFPAPRLKQPAPLLARPILMARALAEYSEVLVFPIHLRMDRDVETQTRGFGNNGMTIAARKELQTLAGLALLAGVSFWFYRERKRDPAVFACLTAALICYLPVSGIIPLNATVAEHWLYLPSAFLFLAVGLVAARFAESASRWRRRLVFSAATLFILFFAGRTFVRTFDWKDQRTFLERTIASGSDSVRMLINLGGLELSEGHFDLAKKHLTAALEREPDQPLALLNLAALAMKENDFAATRRLLQRAKEVPLVEAQAHEMTAILESKETGKVNPTRFHLAARTGIPNWAIEKRYIKVLAETASLDAAVAELRHCLTSQWYRADSWLLLAALETERGQPSEAAKALKRAQELDVHLGDETPTL